MQSIQSIGPGFFPMVRCQRGQSIGKTLLEITRIVALKPQVRAQLRLTQQVQASQSLPVLPVALLSLTSRP